MQQDYFGFKRDKGGASHSAPAGYVPSDYWSMYASSFAEDGSEDQLIAALTKSVPDAWLKKNGFADADTLPDLSKIQMLTKEAGYRGATQEGLDRGSDYYMDQFSRSLQKRLRNDFKKNRSGMEQQGVANLRGQAEDVLKNDLKGIDAEANSRGLLFSGKTDLAERNAAATRANELGQSTTGFVQGLGDMDRQINSDVFGSEIDKSFRQADLNDIMTGQFYKRLQRDVDATKGQALAAQNLGEGLGSFAGSYFGRKVKKPTTGSEA